MRPQNDRNTRNGDMSRNDPGSSGGVTLTCQGATSLQLSRTLESRPLLLDSGGQLTG